MLVMKKGDKIININNPDKVYIVDEVGYYVTTANRLTGRGLDEVVFTKGDKEWVVSDGLSKIKLTKEAICNAFNCVDFEIID